MKNYSWWILMFLFLGLVWMFKPAWGQEQKQEMAYERSKYRLERMTVLFDLYEKEQKKQQIYRKSPENSYKTNPEAYRGPYKGIYTAYTAIPELTDDSPTITASLETVEIGGCASNDFPFGTFISSDLGNCRVNDRMNSRYSFNKNGIYNIDIFLPTYTEAKEFGVKEVEFYIKQKED